MNRAGASSFDWGVFDCSYPLSYRSSMPPSDRRPDPAPLQMKKRHEFDGPEQFLQLARATTQIEEPTMSTINQQVLLAGRPQGEPTTDHFNFVEREAPKPG